MPEEGHTFEGIMQKKGSINYRLSQGHAKLAGTDNEAIKATEELRESLRTDTEEGVELLASLHRNLNIVKDNPTAKITLKRQFDIDEAILLGRHREGLLTPIDDDD